MDDAEKLAVCRRFDRWVTRYKPTEAFITPQLKWGEIQEVIRARIAELAKDEPVMVTMSRTAWESLISLMGTLTAAFLDENRAHTLKSYRGEIAGQLDVSAGESKKIKAITAVRKFLTAGHCLHNLGENDRLNAILILDDFLAEVRKTESVSVIFLRNEWNDICAFLLAAKDKWVKEGEYPGAAATREVVDKLKEQLDPANAED